MSYVISCCSTADMNEDYFIQRDIHYICFHYELNGKQYPDDLGKSMPFQAFYRAMTQGAETKTSQVNADEFISYFTPFLKEGKDILHLTLSSGISGVYNSAMLAKETLEEQFPDRKIYIVDSLAASSGFGLLVDGAADRRDEGKSIDEVRVWVEENKLKLHHWFFSTDLTFYVKGGRVSKTAGFIGTMLNLCPLLNVNNAGRLIVREKIRTKRKVIARIEEMMRLHARDGLNYNGKCFISNSACEGDARAVADLVERDFPNLNGKVVINSIGTTIGSHTGPGTVALFFWGDTRTE